MHVHVCSIVAAGCVLSAASAQSEAPNAFEFRSVVILGEPTPGGGTFEQVGPPVINNAGTCAFWGDGSGFLEAGIYRATAAGSIVLLLPELHGIEGYRYDGHIDETLMINDQNHVAFVAQMNDGPDPLHEGEWILRFKGLAPEVIMRQNDPAPTTTGGSLGTLRQPDRLAFNNAGDVAFASRVSSPDGEGIFRSSRGGLVAIARTGDPGPHGGTITEFYNLSLGDDGFVSFAYAADGASTPIGIARGDGGPLQLLVEPQQPAPGGELVSITSSKPAFNDAGHALFQGTLKIGVLDDEALFVHDDNGLRILAREGEPSPNGVQWSHAFRPIAMDEAGRAIFRGYLSTSASESGIYVDDGELHQMAHTEDFAPGYWPGHQFHGFQYALASNNLGTIAVLGILTITSYDGLWATDALGDLHEVARFDTPFEYTPGFTFAPTQIRVHTTNHGAATGHAVMNDQRELAFAINLGVFVAILDPADCNDNRINDADEAAADPLLDLNGDGSLDECQYFCPADFVTSATFAPPPDMQVDGADLAYLLGKWGPEFSQADIVSSDTLMPPPDGQVDGADLAVLLGTWGSCF